MGSLAGGSDKLGPAGLLMTEEDEQIKRMMERAFGRAFEAQIGQLFKVYLTNPDPEKQREYTARGIENAVAAYRLSVSVVAAWEG
jgi:hypothetical protein